MKYERPKYLDPSVKMEDQVMMFTNRLVQTPCVEHPISIKENFKRSYKRDNPLWVPNSSTDFYNVICADLTGAKIEADWTSTEKEEYKDWFGIDWVFVPVAGGPMLKPGTQFLDDITQWEKRVKFPNLNDYDYKGVSERILKQYNEEKVFHVNIGLGCTERLVAVLGGYTDAMVALALEPEAVRDFLFAFVDFTIEHIEKIRSFYPLEMITYHDDWGTERDTFFSEKMMEEIVYEPTERLFNYVKSKDICLELHSCGKIDRFIPYMIDLGADFIQIQRRTNDMPMIKQKYGDKIGINAGIEGLTYGPGLTSEKLIEAIRNTVDIYAPGGGFYTSSPLGGNPELAWEGLMELYYYSREFYDNEQGR